MDEKSYSPPTNRRTSSSSSSRPRRRDRRRETTRSFGSSCPYPSQSQSKMIHRAHRVHRVHRTHPAPPPNLELRWKLEHMTRRLSPLVQVDTGRIHPDFPPHLVSFWLLTHEKLDSLARFYHQYGTTSWLRYEYPVAARWHAAMGLEEKRGEFGRFIGLRDCVYEPLLGPGMSLFDFGNWLDGGGGRRDPELLLQPPQFVPPNRRRRRAACADPRSPAADALPPPPEYRTDPNPDIEMTIPAEEPPAYRAAPEDAGECAPDVPSFRGRDGGDDDEVLMRKARGGCF